MTGDVLVVDTSAILAIFQREDGAPALQSALEAADLRLLSTATLVEAHIVLEAKVGVAGAGLLSQFIEDALVDVVTVTRAHARAAADGWRRFGKGRHPAALNFGDCFVYGLAVEEEAAVLCTGNDFARTDIPVVPSRHP